MWTRLSMFPLARRSVMGWFPTLSAMMLLAGAGPAVAQSSTGDGDADVASSSVSIDASVSVVSRYMWRGYLSGGGSANLQPWIELWLPGGLGLNFFSSTALDRHSDVDDVQLGLLYDRELAPGWNLTAGHLAYLYPGTETTPGTNPDDPTAFSMTGELSVALTYARDAGSVTLSYARGYGDSEGNSLNVWAETEVSLPGMPVSVKPYLQLDYIDQYGAPRTLRDRFGAAEIGLPVAVTIGSAALELGGHLTYVPSRYVRESNSAVDDIGALLPWASLTLRITRE